MSISSEMTNCVLLIFLIVLILAVMAVVWFSTSKQLLKQEINDMHKEMQKGVPEKYSEPAELATVEEPADDEQHVRVTLSTSEDSPSCTVVLTESRLAEKSPQQISLKNIKVFVNQGQEVIREKFTHTNYIDCLHIVCSSQLVVTIVVQRTESSESLEQAYKQVNESIKQHATLGNVVIILDGSLNSKQTLGENVFLTTSLNKREIQFPSQGQQLQTVDTAPFVHLDEKKTVTVVANEKFYGFDNRNDNTKFRQTVKEENATKYIKHFKDILFT